MGSRTMTTTIPFTGTSQPLGRGDGKEDEDKKQEDKKNSSGPSNGPNIEEKNAPITANEEAMQIKVEDKNLEDKKKKIVEKDVKTDGEEDEDKNLEDKKKNLEDKKKKIVEKDVKIDGEEDEDKKLEDNKKNGSGSNNTLSGIGAIHGNNNIKRSLNQLTTLNVGKP